MSGSKSVGGFQGLKSRRFHALWVNRTQLVQPRREHLVAMPQRAREDGQAQPVVHVPKRRVGALLTNSFHHTLFCSQGTN
jgi:hypothetical protein